MLGQSPPAALNRVWVSDITYLPRQGGGWLYLAVRLNRCSRKVGGWDVRSRHARGPDQRSAAPGPRAWRRPAAGLVVHSDQGSPYTATRFKNVLTRHGAVQSMSRRGNCYDNAHTESVWSRFKAELLDGSMAAASPAWPKPSSKLATTPPTTMPKDATPPLVILPPTTSKPICKQRPNSVRLS
ncbi:transposase [Hymenobacter rigui]|uniref:Transposase n=1 Tax=Hymenobacter rigui TaxID=334424 RepID=A0A3R9N3W9_9BACT|nr:transposase [Hymenobacter rigui]